MTKKELHQKYLSMIHNDHNENIENEEVSYDSA